MQTRINEKELLLIPRYTKYIEYMLNVITKLPRTEKFNIGNEYKNSIYETMRNILYINKTEKNKRIIYLNNIDTEMNLQRIYLRIMYKSHWIDEKKFNVPMEMLYELGKIVGGLIKHYGKNNTK